MTTVSDTRDGSTVRLPPQSLEAERAVIGAMMLDQEACGRAVEMLDERAFYRRSHQRLFTAIVSLYEKGEAADFVTVPDELMRRGWLEEVGGTAYVGGILEETATSAHVEHHARIVLEKSVSRNLIDSATQIITTAYEGRFSAGELVDRAEEMIFRIADQRDRKSFTALRDMMKETFLKIEEQAARKNPITGVETGFADLDMCTSGFQRSDLVIVAGRPSMGKTAFCLNIAENAALKNKVPVAVFSLEMSKEQLIRRLLSSQARVSGHRLRTGFLRDADWPALAAAASRLAEAPIYIDDTASPTVLEMRAKARRLKAEVNVGMIVIDYLQLVRGSGNVENRQQEISQISRSLKALAKELDVPVVALSQLSRAVESRGGDKRPMLSDLRECVTGDTLVLLADGRRVAISDLVGLEPEVMAMSKTGKIIRAVSDKVWRVGRRPVFEIGLASGRKIRATALHRFFGANGWSRVRDFQVGDRMATAELVPGPVEVSSGAPHDSRSSSALLLSAEPSTRVASDLFWDRITSIDSAGEDDVYDLTVPGPESWLADGIVSHNSGAIEQDADVVMFVYRQAMYEKTDENENQAEIIVAKQRNGPTDTITLTFLKDQTRFGSLDRRHSSPEPFGPPVDPLEDPF